jgi:ABC-2 type transport system permease protein
MVVVKTLGAFFLRDLRTARSYRLSWWLDFSSGIFQIIMFYFLSRIVNLPQAEGTSGPAIDYFSFVVIGLALYNFLITGIGVFANSLRAEQTSGTLEMLLTLPSPPSLITFGVAAYGFTRSALTTLTMLTISAVFFDLRVTSDPLALLLAFVALVASVAMFAALGIVVAAFTIVFKQANSFVGIVTQSLGLISGVFYPIAVLPRPLQLIGELIPLTWALDVLRETLLWGEVPTTRVLILVLTSAATLPFAFVLFHLAVKRAKQEGSLAQY